MNATPRLLVVVALRHAEREWRAALRPAAAGGQTLTVLTADARLAMRLGREQINARGISFWPLVQAAAPDRLDSPPAGSVIADAAGRPRLAGVVAHLQRRAHVCRRADGRRA